MKKLILIALVALTLAAPASAHYGGLWFDTAARTAFNIERKFPRIEVARCVPVPVEYRVRFNAHSQVSGSVRQWDHFLCGLAPRGAATCLVLAHMTGREWNQFVLTSWPRNGCTPYVLR